MLSPTNKLLLALLAPNKFLPMQLAYVGKSAQSLPKFKFPESFSLSANPKHFSNTAKSLKLLDEIIIPYDKSERERLKLEPSQLALLILDIFSGQMTTPVMDKLAENHIKSKKVPTKTTNLFQPLDLTINKSASVFMKKKFTEWYSLEVDSLDPLDPLDPFSTIDFFEQPTDDEIFGRQRTHPTESLKIPWPKI